MGAEVKPHHARLNDLFAAAQLSCDQGASTADFEPAFNALLDFIQLNPACHADAAATLLDALHGRNGLPWELVAFLMHELRWPNIRREALEVIARQEDWRVKAALSHVVEAFEDEWADAVMYQRWRPSGTTE